jgi:hypothetical protein
MVGSKTVIIFDNCGVAPLKFFVVEGDYLDLNNIYINEASSKTQKKQTKLEKLIYNKDGSYKLEVLESFPINEIKKGARVIVAGFLP